MNKPQNTAATKFAPRRKSPLEGKNVVVLGGGTGLSTVLKGLKSVCFNESEYLSAEQKQRLTAIVTVSDDGGSSGILRDAYPILAPGDIRNCMLSLASCNPKLKALFDFRFNGGINGHSLGNLIITAMSQLEKDFTTALVEVSRILEVKGRVLPATPDQVIIEAEFDDGSFVQGETKIAAMGKKINRVSILPSNVQALPEVETAILAADLIIIAPGSLYTSLIPPLLVRGIARAIANSAAKVVMAINIMTEPGETDNFKASDFLRAIQIHVPEINIHSVIVNSAPIQHQRLQQYLAVGSTPVECDTEELEYLGCQVLPRDVLGNGNKINHDTFKFSSVIEEFVSCSNS